MGIVYALTHTSKLYTHLQNHFYFTFQATMDFIKKAASEFSNKKDEKKDQGKGSEQKDDYVDKGE